MRLHRTTTYPSSEYRTVFERLLIGSFIFTSVITALLFISYLSLHNTYVINRIFLCALSLTYLAGTYAFWVQGRLTLASKLLVSFYFVIATIIVFSWGINNPFGLLMFSITIILSGILLGSRYILLTASLVILCVFAIQGYISGGHSFLGSIPPTVSHFGDAVAYNALLSVLALISWLSGRQTEYLFFKNKVVEEALVKEKGLLESRVLQRTNELQKVQLDEMEQLYQFAEMGQLSAVLLHDLANHLSVLNFDIADLKKKQHIQTVHRAEESITYLERIITQAQRQLQTKGDLHDFNVRSCLKDSVKIISMKTNNARTDIRLKTSGRSLVLYGDPLRLSHIVSILIQNAIESYAIDSGSARPVTIYLEQTKKDVVIRVRDQGGGIPLSKRSQLFSPVQSTKKDGLGIGLYIARKITETHFKGTLTLAPAANHTEFVLKLPKPR